MKVLITSGATIEKIDPVRYISNFSSGKQGNEIAKVFSEYGAEVILVTSSNIQSENIAKIIKVNTALEMLDACIANLPVDVAIFTAAVSDWRVETESAHKIKKSDHMTLELVKNPDILTTIANHQLRPKIVVGFAAETENLLENARLKLKNKNCDIILANLVGSDNFPFGSDFNKINFITKYSEESWDIMSKTDVAKKLLEKILKPEKILKKE